MLCSVASRFQYRAKQRGSRNFHHYLCRQLKGGGMEISMKNISVLTEYMKQFPNPDGSQKRVILSEVGFQGTDEEIQAAAYVYSYYQAEANPDIDSLILNRHVDHSVEIAQGAYFGLWKSDPDRHGEHPTEKRKLWYVFRDIDTEKSEEVAQFALPIIGAEQWADVIRSNVVS